MKVKKIVASDNREALATIKKELGNDAVIISSQRTKNGVEVLATNEYKEEDDAKLHITNDVDGSSVVNEYTNEIKALRSLMQEQLSELIWEKKQRISPSESLVIRHLLANGFSAEIAGAIGRRVPDDCLLNDIWETIVGELLLVYGEVSKNPIESGGVFSFQGPSGSGKTLTLAKIASQAALKFGAQNIGLISTDSSRLGAAELLQTYGKILNIPVKIAQDANSLNLLIESYEQRKIILIDNSPDLHENLSLYKNINSIKHFNVVSATSSYVDTKNAIRSLAKLNPFGNIITKVDEATNLGSVFSGLYNSNVPIYFLTNGVQVPDDLSLVTSTNLLTRALAIKTLSKEVEIDEIVARKYSEAQVR